jgi:hypothetical protein
MSVILKYENNNLPCVTFNPGLPYNERRLKNKSFYNPSTLVKQVLLMT